jgi:hypothetical protein
MWPTWMPFAYTVQFFGYIPIRAYTYKRKAWHYFLFGELRGDAGGGEQGLTLQICATLSTSWTFCGSGSSPSRQSCLSAAIFLLWVR